MSYVNINENMYYVEDAIEATESAKCTDNCLPESTDKEAEKNNTKKESANLFDFEML